MLQPQPYSTSRHLKRHQHLAREGDEQTALYLLEDGWACRYRLLRNGQRQINALFLPGEYCEPQWVLRPRASFNLVALTPLRARAIAISDGVSEPSMTRERMTSVLDAVSLMLDRQAEWMVSLARKTAIERLSSLFCELFDRSQTAANPQNNRFFMPLTQNDLADITGLTAVHVNRVIQVLRSEGLVVLESKWMIVPDVEALRRISAPPR